MDDIDNHRRLFVVELNGGSSHPRWGEFYAAVKDLGGRGVEYAGIRSLVILAHDSGPQTVRSIIGEQMTDSSADVEVDEITTRTLGRHGRHRPYVDTVRSFLPWGNFPSIEL